MIEYLTEQGKALLTRAIAGEIVLSFTKIQMGDGEISSGQNISQMLTMVNVKEELEIEEVRRDSNSVIYVTGLFDNSTLSTGFYYREKGLFASDGTTEVLFSYANAGSNAEWIAPPTEEIIEKRIVTQITATQGTDINVSILPGTTISREEFEKYKENFVEIIEQRNIDNSINYIISKIGKYNKLEIFGTIPANYIIAFAEHVDAEYIVFTHIASSDLKAEQVTLEILDNTITTTKAIINGYGVCMWEG